MLSKFIPSRWPEIYIYIVYTGFANSTVKIEIPFTPTKVFAVKPQLLLPYTKTMRH